MLSCFPALHWSTIRISHCIFDAFLSCLVLSQCFYLCVGYGVVCIGRFAIVEQQALGTGLWLGASIVHAVGSHKQLWGSMYWRQPWAACKGYDLEQHVMDTTLWLWGSKPWTRHNLYSRGIGHSLVVERYAKEQQVVGPNLSCLMGSKHWARFGWWAAGVGHNLLVGAWNSRLLVTTFWLGHWSYPFGWWAAGIRCHPNLVGSRHGAQRLVGGKYR